MNVENPRYSDESVSKREHKIFTRDNFLDDNHSLLAEQNRDSFYALLIDGQIFLVKRCSDARGNIPEVYSIDVSNIATDGPQEPYKDLMIYEGVKAIVELTHFDAEKFRVGHYPTGCGGLEAKEKQMLEGPSPSEVKRFGLPRFVEAIKSPDPVVLAYFNAESIASHTAKPVMAAIQDHVSGIISPLAVFKNENGEIISKTKLPVRYMFQGQYDQRSIYKQGIPTLDSKRLPDEFQEFLELNSNQISRLETQYSNLHDILRVQNPSFVIITTEKMSAKLRYPQILKEPGSYFQIHIPRYKQGQMIFIEPRTIETALEQAQYPIEHFSRVDTVLIETGDLAQSKRISSGLTKTPWLQKWQQKKQNHQVFAIESRQGKIIRIEEYK